MPVKLHREVTAHVQVNIKSDAPARPEETSYAEETSQFGSAAFEEED